MAVTGASHRIVIEGVAATVRLGYQRAATLGAWKVDGDCVLAAVEDVDGFRITQSPLTLEIQNADGVADPSPARRTSPSPGASCRPGCCPNAEEH